MNAELLASLRTITDEEKALLQGNTSRQKGIYTSKKDFVIDNERLLAKGRLIEIRPHTRFAHFPKHRHNYVDMVLFLSQSATQEILPAGEDDIAVNFIILPEFFDRPLSMIERDNVLRDFLISTLSGSGSRITYLQFRAKDILPIQNLIENMLWTLINKKSNTNTINQVTMGLIFMNLSVFADSILQNSAGNYEQDMIFRILKYIETHYKSGTLSDISAELKLPPYYVSRLLKKYTGHTFKELLQQQKLQQASYLLSHTTLSANAVMEAIGYSNSSFFYRAFRERFGVSPKEYRSLEPFV